MLSADPIRVFIGYDRRQDIAYRVARHSLLRRTSRPVLVQPLDATALRRAGLFTRAPIPGTWVDEMDQRPFSTDFTFTRFLVPALCQWKGLAFFVDCDFMFTSDIVKLFNRVDWSFPVSVVQHQHLPSAIMKMDGRVQTSYPRKNWSSLIAWNCAHPLNETLIPGLVNTWPGSNLHQFKWLPDDQIGSLPAEWNWLEGEQPWDDLIPPAAVHYTRGGPWMEGFEDVKYAEMWRIEKEHAGW